MTKKILREFEENRNSNRKSLTVLFDPEEISSNDQFITLLEQSEAGDVDYLFVGGSLLSDLDTSDIIQQIKNRTDIPVICFPGNNLQLNFRADGIMFLSLISGRNPEFLIGQHVPVSLSLKKSGMEVIPTGYLLVDGGKPTSVSYISFTNPIPRDKAKIAVSTAVAGELLGLKTIYLEAGSGALYPVPEEMIRRVRKAIDLPLIVGGGINSIEKARRVLRSGADMIVVGNQLEKNPEFITELSNLIKEFNQQLNVH